MKSEINQRIFHLIIIASVSLDNLRLYIGLEHIYFGSSLKMDYPLVMEIILVLQLREPPRITCPSCLDHVHQQATHLPPTYLYRKAATWPLKLLKGTLSPVCEIHHRKSHHHEYFQGNRDHFPTLDIQWNSVPCAM